MNYRYPKLVNSIGGELYNNFHDILSALNTINNQMHYMAQFHLFIKVFVTLLTLL